MRNYQLKDLYPYIGKDVYIVWMNPDYDWRYYHIVGVDGNGTTFEFIGIFAKDLKYIYRYPIHASAYDIAFITDMRSGMVLEELSQGEWSYENQDIRERRLSQDIWVRGREGSRFL